MRNVIVDIIGRDHLSGVVDRAAGNVNTAAGRINRAGKSMTKTGMAMSKAITVPVLAAAAISLHAATDFQKSVTLLNTAGGESVKNLSIDAAGMKKIAVDTGTSLGQLGEGMYTVEKAGYRGAAALKVQRAAAQGSKAEAVDLGIATNALTSVMMSYHIGAGKAVSVQNELIAGSGLAKTTMQEYAGSLSTVIPIASAAGVSFAQVAGAEATLTQHGTSADEATQELANTIRNLQAPNQVAQKAMQQLGLHVNKVSTNLGKRGLTGTIDLITNAIAKKMGPSGLVAVSAFKKSQSAGADLNTMLEKMPKKLKDISQQFLDGKLGMKPYQTAIKELGADGYAMGSQFLALTKTSRGFNDLIKSGQPKALTFAAYLKAIMGGATGLNTALMLGGENMGYFKKATEEVSKAGEKNGKDISTWAKTQANLATQADEAKAKLQVLAVNVGTKLIPVAAKMITQLTKAVDWFERLSPATQNSIMKFALWAAVVGPAVVVVGKLVRAIAVLVGTGVRVVGWAASGVTAMYRLVQGMRAAEISVESMSTRSYAAGLRVRAGMGLINTSSGLAGKAVGGLASVLGGAAIGYGIGELTKNSSDGVKALGLLGSAAAGAAAGFAIGGPLGAALGGIGGLIGDAVSAFHLFGNTTKAQIKPTQELTQAILDDGDAFGKLTQAQVNNTLQSKGLYDAGLKLGISQKTLLRAALGNKDAISQVSQATLAQLGVSLQADKSHSKLTKTQLAQIAASRKLADGMAIVNDTMSVNKHAADNEAAALGKTKSGMDGTALSARQVHTAVNAITKSTGGYLGALAKIPKSVFTKIAAENTLPTIASLSRIRNLIAYIKSGAQIDIGVSGRGTAGQAVGTLSAFGQKTIPPNTAFTVGEEGWEGGVTDAQGRTSIFPAKKALAMGFRAPVGYAKGTGGPITHVGKDWIYAGTRYASEREAANARTRAGKTDQSTLSSTAASSIGRIGSAASAKLSVSDVGIDRIRKQIATARKVLDEQIAKGLSKAAASKYGVELTRYARLAQKQLAALKVKIAKPDTTALDAALKGSVADAQTAFSTLINDARHAGASSKDLDRLENKQKAVIGRMRERDRIVAQLGTAATKPTAYDKLATAQGDYTNSHDSVKSAVSAFDMTSVTSVFDDQPVTAADEVTAVVKAAANATQFVSLLKKLGAEGLPQALIEQLANAGPGALPTAQALSKVTPKQLSAIKSSYKTLDQAGSTAGTYVADKFYSSGVKSAQSLVNGLLSKKSAINSAITTIAGGMLKTLEKSLGIKAKTASEKHKKASGNGGGGKAGTDKKRLDNKPKTPKKKKKGSKIADTINIHEAGNPARTAREVARHQRARSNV